MRQREQYIETLNARFTSEDTIEKRYQENLITLVLTFVQIDSLRDTLNHNQNLHRQ